jgi:competence protein ComEA
VRTPYDPTTPKSFTGSAFDPGRRGWRALAAVGALALLAAAFFAWRSSPAPEPAPIIQSSASAAAAAEPFIVVAVSGKVHNPGLVRLAPGSRVADAIAAAGGPLPDADLSTLNLARKVADGELIAVGVPGPAEAGAVTPGLVNLNTATLAQLDTLPGVGPVLAQRIIDYRSRHGGFRSVADLRQVDGIGEDTFTKLKDLVTVG